MFELPRESERRLVVEIENKSLQIQQELVPITHIVVSQSQKQAQLQDQRKDLQDKVADFIKHVVLRNTQVSHPGLVGGDSLQTQSPLSSGSREVTYQPQAILQEISGMGIL